MKFKGLSMIASALLFVGFMCVGESTVLAGAEEIEEVATQTQIGEEISPQGIFTQLSISIDGSNGKIYATAKNEFTLFPATVQIILELYFSEDYHESYTKMTLATRGSIDDLNIGKSLVVYSPTNGEQLWWMARMRYKIDLKDWQETNTTARYFDGDGNRISV